MKTRQVCYEGERGKRRAGDAHLGLFGSRLICHLQQIGGSRYNIHEVCCVRREHVREGERTYIVPRINLNIDDYTDTVDEGL